MKKQRKLILVLAVMVVFVAVGLFLPGLIGAGDLEPSAAPGPTMKTLDQIPPTWSQILPVSKRFEDVMGGEAVLDKETGLVWAKDANLAMTSGWDTDGLVIWERAILYCARCRIANRSGWRLPTREELQSLFDLSASPIVPASVFNNVQSQFYWSSTTWETDNTLAWIIGMISDSNDSGTKVVDELHVWPVRGGN